MLRARRREFYDFDSLAGLLTYFTSRDGRSDGQIAREADVDRGYLSCLKSGKKLNPNRNLLLRLIITLHLNLDEASYLIEVAGHNSLDDPRWHRPSR